VEKTGRLVIVDEASPRCNLATDISAQVVSEAFGDLRAPIKMVSPPHVPVPFAQPLEDLYIPSVQDIVNSAKTVTEWSQ
jgi:pyruvate dehydrogenase E1 component beta subunit